MNIISYKLFQFSEYIVINSTGEKIIEALYFKNMGKPQ